MFTKSLKKFFAKSKSESFDRSQGKPSLSGLRRFFSLDSATTHKTNSTRVLSPSTQTSTSLYRQPLRQRYAAAAREVNKPRLITRCRRNFEESHSADEEEAIGEGQWTSDDGEDLSDDQGQGRDDVVVRSSFSGFMLGVGSASRSGRGTMLSSGSSEDGSTSASCRPRSLSLAATPSSGNGNGGGPSILKQQRRNSRRGGGGGGGRGGRGGRMLLRYVQRKSLKKQTSFKEDVDVYYYDDPTGTATSTAATSPTTTSSSAPVIPSTLFSDDIEPAAKLFAADCTVGSTYVTADDVDAEEHSASILGRYGSSDSVNEVEITESDTSSQCSDTDKLSAAVLSLVAYSEKDKAAQHTIRNKRYMLQTAGKPLPAASSLAGTVTVTSADGEGDASDVLRAVIYVTDRPTRDVKTVVRAMSDGRAIVVTTYETDVLSTSPPRVEKITLPVQVDPFSMKALVQRQGPLVIEAPVVRTT